VPAGRPRSVRVDRRALSPSSLPASLAGEGQGDQTRISSRRWFCCILYKPSWQRHVVSLYFVVQWWNGRWRPESSSA